MNFSITELKKRRFDPVTRLKTFTNILQEFNLSNKTVLDIGSSYGEFLTHFGPQSVGLTISPEEVKVGREIGLDIQLFNIEQEGFRENFKGKFDVIFANNIFEHMQSSHNFLLKIKPCLRPDGLLILVVPCLQGPMWLIRFRKFRGSLASLHINFFTRETLIKTVKFAGWQVEQARGFHFSNRFVDRLSIKSTHIYMCVPKWTVSSLNLLSVCVN